MEDINGKIPLFKKIDRALFESIDKFKQSPNYSGIKEFYNGLEEEQQKIFKGLVLLVLAFLPLIAISFLLIGNAKLRDDLELRVSIVSRASEILGQNQGLREVTPRVFSMNPIDGQSMMSSRLSNLLSSVGVDISKLQVKEFHSSTITSNVMRSEATISFSNLSTDELTNIFTNLISREKFRISEVNITRNADSNALQGQFQAIHFSSISGESEGED
jgi:hypothetical protein